MKFSDFYPKLISDFKNALQLINSDQLMPFDSAGIAVAIFLLFPLRTLIRQ
jgi:hypothetical protein